MQHAHTQDWAVTPKSVILKPHHRRAEHALASSSSLPSAGQAAGQVAYEDNTGLAALKIRESGPEEGRSFSAEAQSYTLPPQLVLAPCSQPTTRLAIAVPVDTTGEQPGLVSITSLGWVSRKINCSLIEIQKRQPSVVHRHA